MSGASSASSTAATRVPIPSIAKRTRAPRTSSKTARSAATSWLGVYRKSSDWNGASDMKKCPHRTVPDELTLRPVRDPGVSASVPCLPPSPVPSDEDSRNPTVVRYQRQAERTFLSHFLAQRVLDLRDQYLYPLLLLLVAIGAATLSPADETTKKPSTPSPVTSPAFASPE